VKRERAIRIRSNPIEKRAKFIEKRRIIDDLHSSQQNYKPERATTLRRGG